LDPSFATKSFLGAYLPLIIGIVLAGSQIGLNMLSALIIQRTPGYSHVNIGHLGLLFCSRPRLTWLTCVLGLARKWIPRKYFSTTISKTAAKATLASVAVSSTISEGILQIVAIYYMAIAANSGRGKGFYAPHHLKPYDRGLDAWNMYVGALMWLIVCVPIIIIWPVVAMFHARIFFLLHKTRIGLWRLLRLPTNGINPYSHNAHPSADDFNEERTFLYVPLNSRDWNEAGRNPPEDWNERPHDSTGFNERGQEPDDWNDPGSGSSPHVRPEMLEAESLIPRTRIRGGGSSMSVRPEDSWQEAGGNYGITPIGSPSASGITSAGTPSSSGVVNRRSPLGRDSGLRGGDSENDVRMYTSLRGGAGDEIDGGRYYQDNYAYDPPGGRRTPSGGAQYQRVRQVSAEQGLQRQSSLRGGGAAWNTDMPAATKFDYYHFQAPIIWLGVVIGLISYAAQWMFWDGFVKASGERFCHPKLLGTAITWAFGSVISKFCRNFFRHKISLMPYSWGLTLWVAVIGCYIPRVKFKLVYMIPVIHPLSFILQTSVIK
jgi:hypothetical protein